MPVLPQWQIDYYTARQTEIGALLANINAALVALSLNGGVRQYSLNTGQTTQSVTRASIPELEAWRARLQREQFEILGLLNGDTRTIYFRPGW